MSVLAVPLLKANTVRCYAPSTYFSRDELLWLTPPRRTSCELGYIIWPLHFQQLYVVVVVVVVALLTVWGTDVLSSCLCSSSNADVDDYYYPEVTGVVVVLCWSWK